MPKKIVTPTKSIRQLPVETWVDRMNRWKAETGIGYLIFFIPLDKDGHPDETENWRCVLGGKVVVLDLSGFQPVFRLVGAVLGGQYTDTPDFDCTKPVKVLTA